MNEKVASFCIQGISSVNKEEYFNKILKLVTNSSTVAEAKQKAFKTLKEKESYLTLQDLNEREYKAKYGYYKGKYVQTELCLDYVQLGKEIFQELYGFSYIPPKKLEKDIKEKVDNHKLKIYLKKTLTNYIY